MIYTVGNEFVKLNETSGTIQNSSSTTTIEMATEPNIGSGIHVYPQQIVSFHNADIYLRSLRGETQVRYVPFDINSRGGDDDVDYLLGDVNYLRLTFDFPSGNDKTILIPNPRDNLTQADIDAFSDLTVEEDIFRNSYAEPTRGIKKAHLLMCLPKE